MKPEPLKLEFKKQGIRLRQERRNAKAAIYEVLTSLGNICGHEVVMVGSGIGFDGVLRETYPSAEQFGKRGWYYMIDSKTAEIDKKALDRYKKIS